jgi:hypothetical protein
MQSSILVDKNGQRKDLNLTLENAYDVLIKEIGSVLMDTV